MQLLRKVIKGFGKIEEAVIAEEQYLALKAGDRIFVELERESRVYRRLLLSDYVFHLSRPLVPGTIATTFL